MLKLRFVNRTFKQLDTTTTCTFQCEFYNTQTKEVITQFDITGSTKLSENDTFDAVKGKQIAESKAKIKAYNYLKEYIIHNTNYKQKALELIFLADCVENMLFYKKRERSHFNTLIQ